MNISFDGSQNGKLVKMRNVMQWFAQPSYNQPYVDTASDDFQKDYRLIAEQYNNPGVLSAVLFQFARIYNDCYRNYELKFPALQQQCTHLQTALSEKDANYATLQSTLQTERAALTLLRENDQNQITNLEKKVEAEKQQQAQSLRRLEEIQQYFDKEKQELQTCRAELQNQKNENIQNKRTIEEQNEEIKLLKDAILNLKKQNEQQQHRHIEEIKNLKAAHNKRLLDKDDRLDQILDHIKKQSSYSATSSRTNSRQNSDDEGNEG